MFVMFLFISAILALCTGVLVMVLTVVNQSSTDYLVGLSVVGGTVWIILLVLPVYISLLLSIIK